MEKCVSKLVKHNYLEAVLPLARLLSTSGGHYNSIGVFTTTGWWEAYYVAHGSYNNFPEGRRVEPATVTLRGGVKLQAVSLLPAPERKSSSWFVVAQLCFASAHMMKQNDDPKEIKVATQVEPKDWHMNVKSESARKKRSKRKICMCACIYTCCRVIIWAKFGHLTGYYLGQVC